mmetsp:Transcript_15830/g.17900  ORF Transcript_15830/g.17900 Transcript_15830/m.17900 type:complete len:87 (-) Transcript_15830:233-493(-)
MRCSIYLLGGSMRLPHSMCWTQRKLIDQVTWLLIIGCIHQTMINLTNPIEAAFGMKIGLFVTLKSENNCLRLTSAQKKCSSGYDSI